jgi:diguanylate cyclase (GGDEF)-like protein
MNDGETLLRPKADVLPAEGTAEWALVVYAGSNLGRVFRLSRGETIIGRATDADIPLLDEEVSRVHAKVHLGTDAGGQDALSIRDLHSTNGTFLNERRFNESTEPLRPGDRIAVGGHVLKLVEMDPLEKAFHETLLDLGTRDPLTGLANRGAILSDLQTRFSLSRRHDRPLSLIMCDLDYFKAVNDTHGHGAGDMVLAAFGETVRKILRITDMAGRIGGEEFLLVLPESERHGAALLAERLRSEIEKNYIPLQDGTIAVTCSFGVAECRATDLDAGALMGRVDLALYSAKRTGRNKVVTDQE